MRLIKSLLVASVAVTMAGQAIAGGFSAEVVEPPVVVVEPDVAPRSTFGLILPLALLGGLVALAVASEDDDDGDGTGTETE